MVIVPASTTTAVDSDSGLLQQSILVVFGEDARFEASVSWFGVGVAASIERTRDKVVPGTPNNIGSPRRLESQSSFFVVDRGDDGCSNDDEARNEDDEEDEDRPCWYVSSAGVVVRFNDVETAAIREK